MSAISERIKELQLKKSAHEFMKKSDVNMHEQPIIDMSRIRKIEDFDIKKQNRKS